MLFVSLEKLKIPLEVLSASFPIRVVSLLTISSHPMSSLFVILKSGRLTLVFVFIVTTERIANTERHLDIAKGNNQRAEDKANELRQLNRSIFHPVVTWNKVRDDQARQSAFHALRSIESHR